MLAPAESLCAACGDVPVSSEGELCAECLECALEEERAEGSEMPWDDFGSEVTP